MTTTTAAVTTTSSSDTYTLPQTQSHKFSTDVMSVRSPFSSALSAKVSGDVLAATTSTVVGNTANGGGIGGVGDVGGSGSVSGVVNGVSVRGDGGGGGGGQRVRSVPSEFVLASTAASLACCLSTPSEA